MGVLQRFERRLEGLVEGAFAKAFKGRVEPLEIATALEREATDRAAIVSAGRTLVPNDYVVELGSTDYARISPYAEPLGRELTEMLRDAAGEHHWSFPGPVMVSFIESTDLDEGIFRVRSGVASGQEPEGGVLHMAGIAEDQAADPLAMRRAQERGVLPGAPRLVMIAGGDAAAGTVEARGGDRALLLTKPVMTIGRGHDVDIRIDDLGVSRQHARLEVRDGELWVSDLGSTNGTVVDGAPVTGPSMLAPGQRITVGSTSFVYQRDRVH